MKILITGANGQLGKAFQEMFKELNIEYIPTDVNELDITKIDEIREFTKDKWIKHIINCAAYNAVDKAEEDWKNAYLVNGVAVRNLSIVAEELGAELIHYSTNYVFDGEKGKSYTIFDSPNPISRYGESKVLGEKFLTSLTNKYYLIRTSWIFGDGPVNFVKKVIEWSKSKNELKIVEDEISAPTYAPDLAKGTWELVKKRAYGTYHITNTLASRHEWAEYILSEINWKGKLLKAKQSEFKLPAKRPKYTVLDNFGLKETVDFEMPDWKNATKRYLDKLRQKGEI